MEPEPRTDPEGDKRRALELATYAANKRAEEEPPSVGTVCFASRAGASPKEIASATGLSVATVGEILDRDGSRAGEALRAAGEQARPMTTARKAVDPEGEKASALRFAGYSVERYGEGDSRRALVIGFASKAGASPEEIAEATGLPLAAVTAMVDRKGLRTG